MTHEPIQTLEVENYGCIQKASFALTPLHAFIGPNDSGKSTALRALRTAAQFGAGAFEQDGRGWAIPFNPMLGVRAGTRIALRFAGDKRHELLSDGQGFSERVWWGGSAVATEIARGFNRRGVLSQNSKASVVHELRDSITIPTMIRFEPDNLREPAKLIPQFEGIAFADDKGTGLASVFDAIVNRDVEAFSAIQASAKGLFPTVAKLGLINVSDSTKEIAVTLTDGRQIGAKEMSEGLLYFLGFAALKHVTGSRLFLVEEPENGLHPARIAEVMTILREMSKTSQVVIATHSPLVINELRGDEISVVTRNPTTGTKATLLKDVPGFDDASKIYQPGEFWVSYADGKEEEPLLTGQPRV